MATGKLTQKQFVAKLKASIGRKYDHDGWYGQQCYDYANAMCVTLYQGTSLYGESAKDIHTDNRSLLNGRAKIYYNTPSFLAKPGDMVIFPSAYGQGHGHVAWVLSATLSKLVLVEQNWLGGGWTYGNERGGGGWETVTKRTHNYDANMVFIRPNFKKNVVTATASKVKNKVTAKKIKWSWKGRFTANATIKVRRSPSLSGSVVGTGSWIYKNQWVDFNQLIKKDGYWWIRFKYPTNPRAGYFYLAVCKITDKKERIKHEKYWGRIKWK